MDHRRLVSSRSFLCRSPSRTPTRRFLGRASAFAATALIVWSVTLVPARAHEELGEAILTATRRIASSQHPAFEYMMRGELYRLEEEFEEAVADYDSASALDPTLPGLDLCRAELMYDRGRF